MSNKLTWALQILLAVAFLGAGAMKLTTPKAKLLENPAMGWANDFSEMQIQLIGAAEVAGGIGLVAPAATGILPILTPVAGIALAVIMAGAAVTHIQRGEPFVFPALLGALSALVAYLRFRHKPNTAARAASATRTTTTTGA